MHTQSWTLTHAGSETSAALGVFEFPHFISFSRVSVFLRDQDSFDQAIFNFVSHFFIAAWSPLLALNWTTMSYSPCFQSSILWGKRKQSNHTAGTAASSFIKIFWIFVSKTGFHSHPLPNQRNILMRLNWRLGTCQVWLSLKLISCSLELVLVADTWQSWLTTKFISYLIETVFLNPSWKDICLHSKFNYFNCQP